jgi:hypothetical protein
MEKPIYLKDPKTGSVVVLDQTKMQQKLEI